MNKRQFKKSSDELQEYFKFKKHSFVVPPKKGKGSYRRKRKHKEIYNGS